MQNDKTVTTTERDRILSEVFGAFEACLIHGNPIKNIKDPKIRKALGYFYRELCTGAEYD